MNKNQSHPTNRHWVRTAVLSVTALLALLSAGCGREEKAPPSASGETYPAVIRLDWAYWSPLSIVLKDKQYLEKALRTEKIESEVTWTFSAGSNKSLEFLNSRSTDFGSSAGAAALISRANGNPVSAVYSPSKPEWTALVVTKDSPIKTVKDLKGKKVAATRGTDPFVFLARALDANGLNIKDIENVAVQHSDGKNAMLRGDVDAWAGLDPLMAQAELEDGARFLYQAADFNTYNVLSVRDDWLKSHPQLIKKVIAAYEEARKWALANPAEYQALVARDAKLTDAVAAKVIERTDIRHPKVGREQIEAIHAAGIILQKGGVIEAGVNVLDVVNRLIVPQFAEEVVKP